MVVVAADLLFALAHMINIVTQYSFDYLSFTELPVFGDLNEGDISVYFSITGFEEGVSDILAVVISNVYWGQIA